MIVLVALQLQRSAQLQLFDWLCPITQIILQTRQILINSHLVNVGILEFFLHTVSNPVIPHFCKVLHKNSTKTDLVSAPSVIACDRLYSVEMYSVLLSHETLLACC